MTCARHLIPPRLPLPAYNRTAHVTSFAAPSPAKVRTRPYRIYHVWGIDRHTTSLPLEAHNIQSTHQRSRAVLTTYERFPGGVSVLPIVDDYLSSEATPCMCALARPTLIFAFVPTWPPMGRLASKRRGRLKPVLTVPCACLNRLIRHHQPCALLPIGCYTWSCSTLWSHQSSPSYVQLFNSQTQLELELPSNACNHCPNRKPLLMISPISSS